MCNRKKEARIIKEARYLTTFTDAGISTESGIPPFRGPNGLWSRYDPGLLKLGYFYRHPEKVWLVLIEIFYESFRKASPSTWNFVFL